MESIVDVEELTKYYGELHVLNKISFDVKGGEFISIIGPSGCGKTTLLKILGGLIKPTSGKVRVKEYSAEDALKQRKVGFVFQNPILLPWLNVKQNVELPLDIIGREVKEISIQAFEKEIESEQFFDGWDGLKQAMDDILRTMETGEEYVVFMIGEVAFTEKRLEEFFLEFHKKREEKGIKIRALSPERILQFIKKGKESQYDIISYKVLKEKYPRGVNIYKNKIIFISWDKKYEIPRVRLVKSKKLADAYRLLFERAWEIDHLPQKLLEIVELKGFEGYYPKQLSGGMQARTALARGLIFDPEILLMDEPFGSLDELTRERLNMELLQIWEKTKKTIILVTHSIPESVFLSDRIVVLSQRPVKIEKIINVELPRPRKTEMQHSKKCIELIECLREILKED